MANPLTLYVPIKQEDFFQKEAIKVAAAFVDLVKDGLNDSKIVHYARLALVPNTNGEGAIGLLLVTTFDGGMNPYLKYFWDTPGLKEAFVGFAALALVPPSPPVTDLTSFEIFINTNNINKGDHDLYEAYPDAVIDII